MSANGRFVAFSSESANLDGRDVNGSIPDVFVRDRVKGTTEVVSVNTLGVVELPPLGNLPLRGSIRPSISANGRFVAFASALPLVENDLNQYPEYDIFVHDRKTGETELVSVTSEGKQVIGQSSANGISISADGRYVAFMGVGTLDPLSCGQLPILPKDCAGNIFVHDRTTGETTVIPATAELTGLSISGNGRYVEFTTKDPLVAGDIAYPKGPSVGNDVYIYDLKEKKFELISRTKEGTPARYYSFHPANTDHAMSYDGRYVTFESISNDLVPNDTNGSSNTALGGDTDIFVLDRESNRMSRVTTSEGPDLGWGEEASISGNGRYVLLESGAPGRVGGNGQTVTVYDRNTGAAELLLDEEEGGTGAINASGRHLVFDTSKAFDPDDGNAKTDFYALDRGDPLGGWVNGKSDEQRSSGSASDGRSHHDAMSNGSFNGVLADSLPGADLIAASWSYRPALGDVFVRLDLEEMPTVAPGAVSPLLYGFRFRVGPDLYELRAQRSSAGVSLPGGAEFGFFRCAGESGCIELAALRGGYGTTGESIVFSLPAAGLSLDEDSGIFKVEAFTALGSYADGPVLTIDRVSLD